MRFNYASSFEQTSNQSNAFQKSEAIQSFENNTTLYFLLTSEQRKLNYDNYVKKLMNLEKGTITENDKNDLETVRKIVDQEEKQVSKYFEHKCMYLFI